MSAGRPGEAAPVRSRLRPRVLAALRPDPQPLADLCIAVGRDPKDRTVRRVLDGLAADGEAQRTVDGWHTATAAEVAPALSPGDSPPSEPAPPSAEAEAFRALAEMAEREAAEMGPLLAVMADRDAEALRALHELAERDAEDAETLAEMAEGEGGGPP